MPYDDPEGLPYRRPSVGGLVSGGAGAGPFSGYGPPGYAPSSHTEFHGGEYMIGGYPGVFAGTYPPMGDYIGAGGVSISGFDSGGTLPVAQEPGSAARGGRRTQGIPHRHGPHAGRGPRGYRRSDARIEEDVNERLTWHSEVNAEDIEVRVEDGEVTLTGKVDSRFEKRLAADIAESCSGVVDVRNRLKIRKSD